jgi:sulfur-carrier protein
MIAVSFAPALQRHHTIAAQEVAPGRLAEVLDAALQAQPALRHYLLTDQGHIRKHVAVFVDNAMHLPRTDMQRAVPDGAKVLVVQCLTGG